MKQMFTYELEPRLVRGHIQYLDNMLEQYMVTLRRHLRNIASFLGSKGEKSLLCDMAMRSSLEDVLIQLEYARKYCREYFEACDEADAIANDKAKTTFGPRYVWNEDTQTMEMMSVEEAAKRQGLGVMEYLAWEAENLYADDEDTYEVKMRPTDNL